MGRRWFSLMSFLVVVLVVLNLMVMVRESSAREFHNIKSSGPNYQSYSEALTKSILFFEGQRSGRLPSSQRMKWRKDSALNDGHDVGVDLVGGYYDAGDNVKFNFPMAFTTTMLSWGMLEFGKKYMGAELDHAKEAIKWGTDYLLKATSVPDVVYVQVGDPWSDHSCWQRPEEMVTSRTAYAVDKNHPGSEVAAEIAAALASSSLVFKDSDPQYSQTLLNRAIEVFKFADTYRGSMNDYLRHWVCPFYCDWSGYMDELIWGAAWLYKATKKTDYLNYVVENIQALEANPYTGSSTIGEFGWDNKHAGINVLMAVELQAALMNKNSGQYSFIPGADKFVCTVLPESPTNIVLYSPGGLMFKKGSTNSNLQNAAALSFLLVVYARHINVAKRNVQCGSITASPGRLTSLAKKQVDYILGDNPMKMSYMVGYGDKFPQKIHHRGSVLPSMDDHPEHFECQGGRSYFESDKPNPNVLIGAVVGGPALNDSYVDSRDIFIESEPTTYINAPLVGLFAFFEFHHGSN